jgi:hypothetical protein
MDPEVEAYRNYFEQPQVGGGEVFVVRERNVVGSGFRSNQYGNGFLDWLKGLARKAFPVLLKGTSNFVKNLNENTEKGLSFQDAAKSGNNL